MPWVYAPLEISKAEVESAVKALRSINVQGANVTVPYKEEVLAHLDQVEREAARLGSVNTIYRRGEKIIGTSTDGEGFLRSLGSWRKKLRGSTGLLIGAGGAAKAVAEAMARSGAKGLYIANRSAGRAQGLSRLISKRYPQLKARVVSLREGEKVLDRCDWAVQSTSLGLKAADPSPLSLARARAGTLVVDLVYHRPTAFLGQARQKHLPNLGGLGMLLHQGAMSFEYWTGRKAPLNVMRNILLRQLAPS
jgi:shikimate dehydrogenase